MKRKNYTTTSPNAEPLTFFRLLDCYHKARLRYESQSALTVNPGLPLLFTNNISFSIISSQRNRVVYLFILCCHIN